MYQCNNVWMSHKLITHHSQLITQHSKLRSLTLLIKSDNTSIINYWKFGLILIFTF